MWTIAFIASVVLYGIWSAKTGYCPIRFIIETVFAIAFLVASIALSYSFWRSLF